MAALLDFKGGLCSMAKNAKTENKSSYDREHGTSIE